MTNETSQMRKWIVTGTKKGQLKTVVVEAQDHNAAVMAGSKGKSMLVVKTCVLLDARAVQRVEQLIQSVAGRLVTDCTLPITDAQAVASLEQCVSSMLCMSIYFDYKPRVLAAVEAFIAGGFGPEVRA